MSILNKEEIMASYGDTDLARAQGLIYSDKPLSAKMISSLMHVETSITSTYEHEEHPSRRSYGHTFAYYFGLCFVSVLVALSIGLFFSYAHEMGPFAPGAEFSLD